MSYIDFPIGVAGVYAHITTIRKSNGKIVLRGYAMDQESGAKVGPRHQRTCNQSIHSEKHEAQILANIIRDEYCGSQAKAEKTKRAPSAAGAYSDAYMNFLRLDIHNPKWNFNTEYKARTYFERNILPRLDALGTDLSSEDLAEIKNDLVEMAVKSKNGNQNPNQAEKSVSQYLYRVNWILGQIYAYNTSLRELYFDTVKTTAVPVTEEAKYIPDRVRVCIDAVAGQRSQFGSGGYVEAGRPHSGSLRHQDRGHHFTGRGVCGLQDLLADPKRAADSQTQDRVRLSVHNRGLLYVLPGHGADRVSASGRLHG